MDDEDYFDKHNSYYGGYSSRPYRNNNKPTNKEDNSSVGTAVVLVFLGWFGITVLLNLVSPGLATLFAVGSVLLVAKALH